MKKDKKATRKKKAQAHQKRDRELIRHTLKNDEKH